MTEIKKNLIGCVAAVGIVLAGMTASLAAGANLDDGLEPSSQWELEVRPYAWVLFITGSDTLGANTLDVDTNLFELVDKSDEIYALMGYQELRYGRIGLFADIAWSKLNVGASTVKTANPIAGLNVNVVADADIWFDLAIAEPGVALEIANWKQGTQFLKDATVFVPTTAFDLIGGARYWWLKPDVDLNVTATVNIPALGLTRMAGGRISAQPVFDWWDPFIGIRVRHEPREGQEFFLKGDIGGFGIGSDITWQAATGYSFETRLLGIPMTSYLGYRALYIDYEQGSGNRTFGLDTLWHGPVVGSKFTW